MAGLYDDLLADLTPAQTGDQGPSTGLYDDLLSDITPGNAGDSSFMGSMARGVDLSQAMGGGFVEAVGEATGIDPIKKWGREVRERNVDEMGATPRTQAFTDINSFGDAATWAKETAGEQIPMMAPSMVGGLGGAALGAATPVPGGAIIGGIIGAVVPSFVMGTGETQMSIKDKAPDVEAPDMAFLGGSAIAALDSVLPGKIGSRVAKAFGKEAGEEIIKKALSKRIAFEAAKGMTIEGSTEAIQEAVGEAAAAYGTGQQIDWTGLKEQMIEAGAAGALMGGGANVMTEVGTSIMQDGQAPGQTPGQTPAPAQPADPIQPSQANNQTMSGDAPPATPMPQAPQGLGDKASPVKAEVPMDVDLAATQADTAPTDAQKEAGNYKKGHVKVQGLDIAIENPKGSVRSGTDEDGKAWQTVMRSHYGYLKTAEGADGDKVDVFINTDTQNIGDTAFVVDQVVGGKFDEHKVILGADSEAEAKAIYQENYAPDWNGIGAITPMPMEEFKAWLKSGKTKKPLAWQATEETDLIDDGLPLEMQAPAIPDPLQTIKDATVSHETNAEQTQKTVTFNVSQHYGAATAYAKDGSKKLTAMGMGRALGVGPKGGLELLDTLAARGVIRKNGKGDYRRIPVRKGPVDILTFIADRGGLRDDEGHDLKKGRSGQRFIPGVGPLLRANGHGVDTMGEMLWEAGYFGPVETTPRPTEAQILEVLDRAWSGKKVYLAEEAHLADEANAVAESKAARNEVGMYASRLGLDLTEDELTQATAWTGEGIDIDEAVIAASEQSAAKWAEAHNASFDTDAVDVPWDEIMLTEPADLDAGIRYNPPTVTEQMSGAYAAKVKTHEPRTAPENGQPDQYSPGQSRPQAEPGSQGRGVEARQEPGEPRREGAGQASPGVSPGKDATNQGAKINTAPADNAGVSDSAPITETVTNVVGATEQGVIPGAEKISDKALAERKMEGPMKAKAKQKDAGSDGGLFDTGARDQGDLLAVKPRDTKPVVSQKTENTSDKPNAKKAEDTNLLGEKVASTDKIDDFGEKIGGARKDTFTGFKDSLTSDVDIKSAPLSKAFPQPNYVKLAEEGVSGEVLAYIAVIRNTIPVKPRAGWKVGRWVAQVQLLRGLTNDILSGSIDTKTLDHKMKVANATTLGDIPTTVKAIKDVAPQDMEKAAQYSIRSGSYSVFKGQRYSPSKTFWFITDAKNRNVRNPMGNDPAMQDTHRESEEEAIALAKKLIPYLIAGKEEVSTKARSKYTPVNVYRDRTTSDVFLGFKVRSTVLRLKAGFDTPAAAREYLAENRDEVQAKIDDMRKGPNMRGTENRARSGQDLREGDVSPETFSETFGFRGVQFGNYVEGPRRQSDLNRAYDALMDLADTIGVPPKAISLNGELGLAFGARGTGGNSAAAAHYEPGHVVINLTKGSGPGSLAHEWLHGLDNYFARQDDHGKSKAAGQDNDYMSSRRRTEGTARDEVYQAWKGVQASLAKGGFAERAVELDKAKSKPYWNKTIEKAARAFEKYMVDRLSEKGAINDYLANIDQTSGAYPTNQEMKQDGIREAFDNLFDVIEHRETDKGVELYRADGADTFRPDVDIERLEQKLVAIVQRLAPQTDIKVVKRLLGIIPGRGIVEVSGVYRPLRNLIEVSLSRGNPEITVRHEIIHALREMGLFSTTEWNILAERARRDWIGRYNIERMYSGLTKEQKIEEAIAQAFAEYEAGNAKMPFGLRRILNKIKEFLNRLSNALHGMGFQTIDDVFERVERGEVGRREAKAESARTAGETAPAYAAARHQLVEDETAWAETIQAYRDGALRSDKPVPVMETPLVMDIIGESSQPITMDYSILKKVLDDKHGLPDHLVAQLPSRMADPIAVFDSKTADGALVFMLDLTDQDGATVMVALHLEVDKGRGFIVHDIASTYGRKQFRPNGAKPSDGWYVSQIEEGRARYIHQRRSLEWAQSRGLQLPKEGTIRGSKGIIATERDLFNAKRQSPDRYAATQDKDKYSLFDGEAEGAETLARHAAGAQQTPEQKQSALKSALDQVKDFVIAPAIPHPKDLNWFAKALVHPRMIAEMFPKFTPIWMAAEKQFKRRDTINAQLTRTLEPYHALEHDSKERVHQVLEIGRLQGEVIDSPMVGITNKLVDAAAMSKQGDRINLTKEESEAYHAVRAAMDQALDLYKGQVLKEWGFGKEGDPATAKELEAHAKDLYAAGKDAESQEEAAELRREADTAKQVAEIIAEIESAKKHGYVPFSRFGDVSISVRDSRGGLVHFEKIEVGGAMGRMVNRKKVQDIRRKLVAQYPKSQGYDVEEARQMTNANDLAAAGIKIGDVDALAELGRLEGPEWESVRKQLNEASKKVGFRKHFIGAKNTKGYSTDLERSIADYVTGISSYLARREVREEMETAQAQIPKQQRRLRGYAESYAAYIQSPGETMQWLRSLNFFYYLSGNISSAMVNLTQVPLATMPYLSQFAPVFTVNKEFAKAYKDLAKMTLQKPTMDGGAIEFFDPSKAPPDVREDLQAAWDDGTLVPLVTLEQMGIAHGREKFRRGIGKGSRATIEFAGSLFTGAERANRIVTFIAAHRLARRVGTMSKATDVLKDNALWQQQAKDMDPKNFAVWVIDETHFKMGKVNRPTLFRGVGTVIFQFRGFSVNYLELMWRMAKQNGPEGKKAMAMVAGALIASAGIWGLPFADDLKDIIEAIYAWANDKDIDLEAELRTAIYDATGSALAAEAVNRGPMRMTGADVSRRLGMGSILPTDSLLSIFGVKTRNGGEVLGVPMDMTVGRIRRVAEHLKNGQSGMAATELLPSFAKNPAQALFWSADGVKSGGVKVIPGEDLTDLDVVMKFVGFTPTSVTRKREQEWTVRRAQQSLVKLTSRYYKRLARSIVAGDKDALVSLRQEMADYNKGRPMHERIILYPGSIKRAVKTEALGYAAREGKGPVKTRAHAAELRNVFPD